MTTQAIITIEVGHTIATEEGEAVIVSIKGRWVKLDDGTNVSRAVALEGREQYLLDEAQDEQEEEQELDEEGLADAEPDEEEGHKMAETIRKYRQQYTTTVSYSGNNSLDNGDQVAEILRGMSPNETCALADKVFEVEPMHHWERWQHLNAGSRRMNAGNRIRGAVKRGDVTVDQLRDYADHKDIKIEEGDA